MTDARFAYSNDRLAVASGGDLYYWDGATLTAVTDLDVGTVWDVVWVDGYFMVTDGEFIAVSDLNDPTSFDPTKYASSEVDPDKIVALVKIRNEVHVINRYTIEVFQNVGGSGFPFQRIQGAQTMRGATRTDCACEFNGALAFVGGNREEESAVWLASGGQTAKLSTREIDALLNIESLGGYSTAFKVESRKYDGRNLLYIHIYTDLTDSTKTMTLVYDHETTQAVGQRVWYKLQGNSGNYPAVNFVYVGGQWYAGGLGSTVGKMTDSVSTHYSQPVNWEFTTKLVYNEGRDGIVHGLELVGTVDGSGTIGTSKSYDIGVTWDTPQELSTDKRLKWFRQGRIENFRNQRFQGDSGVRVNLMRLEANIEGSIW